LVSGREHKISGGGVVMLLLIARIAFFLEIEMVPGLIVSR
jgi:hypothetical protein